MKQVTPNPNYVELHLGTVKDIPSSLELVREAYNCSPTGGIFKADKAARYLEAMLQRPLTDGTCICLKPVGSDEIVGFLLGSIVPDPFSNNRYAIENHWYIKPDYRSFKSAVIMLDALEYWAERNKATAVYISSGVDPRLLKLLERRKYHQAFSVMIKDI